MPTQQNNSLDTLGSESAGGELKAACEHIVREVIGGVEHGFFRMSIKVETVHGKRKQMIVESGKSYRFIVWRM